MRDGMRPATGSSERVLTWLVGIIAAICAIWVLRVASIVAIPLTAAFFVAIVVQPVLGYLGRTFPRPRWAPLALTMGLLVVLAGGTIWAMAEAVDEAAEAAPRHMDRAQQLWRDVEQWAQGSPLPVPASLLSGIDVQQRLTTVAEAALRVAWEVTSGVVLVFFLVLLMLIEAGAWSEKTRRVLRDGRGAAALESVREVAAKVRTYLYVRTVLGLASAAAAGVWLLLLDVDLVLVWVVLTFALNYIPNIGSIIAVIPPSLMAALQHGPLWGLVTLGGLAVVEQIIGNYIDPRMQGRRLQISPVVVLVAVVFWSWMWGAVGAVLAVPITVALLAAADRVQGLQPLVSLLTLDEGERGDRQHAA